MLNELFIRRIVLLIGLNELYRDSLLESFSIRKLIRGKKTFAKEEPPSSPIAIESFGQ